MFTAKIANYFGFGCEGKHYHDGSWSLCIIKLKLGKYHVVLEQDRSIVTKNVRREGVVPSSTITIDGVKSYSEGESIVRDICNLLSLASMSQVRPYYFEFNNHAKRIPVIGEAMNFRPLIEIHDGDAVKPYIEQVWTKYRKLKRTRKLAEVIDMLTTCELPKLPLEIQLAQMFVLLENLKGTFAKQANIPFISGFFRELSNPLKANLKKEKTLSFKELLERMFATEGMKPRLRRIINLRNEIIHFGLSRKPYESLRNNYDYCHDVVREYLLRLLGFSGEYLVYSKASRVCGRI